MRSAEGHGGCDEGCECEWPDGSGIGTVVLVCFLVEPGREGDWWYVVWVGRVGERREWGGRVAE